MIEKLFNHPYLLHQTADSDVDMANATIGAYIDNGGTICLSQEGRWLYVNQASVPGLCKLLKKLAALETKAGS